MGGAYTSLDFTETFLRDLSATGFGASEKAALLQALRLLDENERHPSLRVHQLHGDRDGSWSVSASSSLRMTFERRPGGRKRMLTCSRHYER
jgi:mRNA-degrading endonuclease YafQ of YafQ-DinJ toxin-antitoxin module